MSDLNTVLIVGGLTIGALFAYIVQKFRFCLVGGTSSLILIGDFRQVNAFLMTWLVAILGTQMLELTGIVAIAESSYRNSQLDWFGAAVGGIVFGIGATISGGCAIRCVMRSMQGSVYAIITLIAFALTAAITQFGFLEAPRLYISEATSIMLSTDAGIASMLSLSPWLVLGIIIVLLSILFYTGWRRSPDKGMLIAGCINGGLVVLGWYITGVLAQNEFMPVQTSSITLSGPLARFGYLLMSGSKPELSFSVAFAIGLAVASLLIALMTRQFKLSLSTQGAIKFAVLGGMLMGLGATLAYGCNVGQGMSGISTLSLESMIAVTGMVTGIAISTKWMEHTDS
jgi:uncharacterized membrane protein YedE/YeeE